MRQTHFAIPRWRNLPSNRDPATMMCRGGTERHPEWSGCRTPRNSRTRHKIVELGKSINRILIIRLSAIGDVVNTLPSLSALRRAFPKAYIAWIVEDKAEDIVSGNSYLDEIFVFPKKRWIRELINPLTLFRTITEVIEYVANIRSRHFDISLDFQGNLKGGLHSILSGATYRIGFDKDDCKEFNHLFSNIRVGLNGRTMHRIEKFLYLLSAIGIQDNHIDFNIEVAPDAKERIRTFLKSVNCEIGEYIVIHPGTSKYGSAKRWHPHKYAAVADKIAIQYNLNIIITYGPGEKSMADSIKQAMKHIPIIPETKSLKELIAIIESCRLFIGSDSAPLRIADALSVPSIALFAPKSPSIYGPYNTKKYKIIHKSTMNDIAVDEVLSAVEEIIGSP